MKIPFFIRRKAQLPAQQDNGCYFTVSPEKFWKPWLRKILRAYWQHKDIQPPCEVLIKHGCYERPGSVEVYREPAEGLRQVCAPIYARDALVVRVEVRLSWLDWLRCLFGCTLHVNSVTYCENEPGHMKTETHAFTSLQ